MWFPLNKSLWTSSYVMFTSGMALLFFGMCYWLIDVKGIKWWTKPFVVYGMNAITVFALSGLLAKTMGIIKVTNEWINRLQIRQLELVFGKKEAKTGRRVIHSI